MPARPDAASTLRFLLQDEAFPRAVCACLGEFRDLVKALPHNERILAACTDTAVLVAEAPVARPHARRPAGFPGRAPACHRQYQRSHRGVVLLAGPSDSPVRGDVEAGGRTGGRHRPRSVRPLRGAAPGKIGHVAEDRVYRVTHTTTYEYAAPVEQSYNESPPAPPRHRPSGVPAHTTSTSIPRPAPASSRVDPFGNPVATFVVQGGFDRMSVTATSEVMVSPSPRPAGRAHLGSRSATLLEIDRQPAARDARRCRAPSRLVPTSTALADYAQGSFLPGRSLVESVMDLTDRIYRGVPLRAGLHLDLHPPARGARATARRLPGLRPPDDRLHPVSGAGGAVRERVHRDVAAPGQERLVGADASHAWASVYLPGWGWVDVDPTNDQFVAESYITTAWGRDYWDVSPLRGSVEGGGGSHHLDVAVDVTRVVRATAHA